MSVRLSITRWARLVAVALCVLVLPLNQAEAATTPSDLQDTRIPFVRSPADSATANGFFSPTTLAVLPDGRVIVVQQNGLFRIVKNDVMLSTPFWDIRPSGDGIGRADPRSERGCLGIVADPDFATTRAVYIYCTIKISSSQSRNRVMRVFVAEGFDRVTSGPQTVLDLPAISFTGDPDWHHGGALRFGPVDGKLYVAVGNHEDNPVAPPSNAQVLTNPFGKILRVNKEDGSPASGNPFIDQANVWAQRIWNRGHRNAFGMDIGPDGKLYMGDVGQSTWEEINVGVKGENFGWPYFEGTMQRHTPPAGLTRPFYAYRHEDTDGVTGSVNCTDGGSAVTGIAFYNKTQFPTRFQNKVFFMEFCGGSRGGAIRVLDPTRNYFVGGSMPYPVYTDRAAVPEVASGIPFPVGMAVAPNGTLYYVSRGKRTGAQEAIGQLNKIVSSAAPSCRLHPEDKTASPGQPVEFCAEMDRATSLQWQRADAASPTTFVNIVGATGNCLTLPNPQVTDSGDRFRLLGSNASGTGICGPALLTVTENRPPVPTINQPSEGGMVKPGQTVSYSGSATDPDQGSLPCSSLTWSLSIQHDNHEHNFGTPHTGCSGSFIENAGDDALEANMWYRISLTARDSGSPSLTTTTFRDLFPDKQLSSMDPVQQSNGSGPIQRNRSNGGNTITIGSIAYPRGWGVHAPSTMVFDVTGCTGSFISDIGVDEEVGGTAGSVVFQTFVDDVAGDPVSAPVFQSPTMTGASSRGHINVSLAGRTGPTFLKLRVSDAGDGNASDHADWAGPRVTGCGSTTPVCVNAPSNGAWQNSAFTSQAGTFTAEFDATPSGTINGVVGLSSGAQTTYTGLATIVRFNSGGTIDARNGGTYAATNSIPYTGGTTYRFRLVVNVATKRYSIFVTPAGQSERVVGENFAFRTEQAGVTQLNNWAVNLANTPAGSLNVCGFRVSSGSAGPENHWIEAESATDISAPMQVVADGNASGGSAIQAVPGNNSSSAPPATGSARYTVTITQAGNYKLWGRVTAPATTDDSFWVRVNGGTWARWNGIPPGAAYHWDDVHSDLTTGSPPIVYSLPAGTATIEVAYREDGTRLDKLLLTNDLSFVPTGMGN